MAINLQHEISCGFNAQDRYDIISAAIEDSYDEGFMNAFVFERALYCYIYATFNNPEVDSRIEEYMKIHSSPLDYWDEHLQDMDEMATKHTDILDEIADQAYNWFEDYTKYAYSTRGMLDNLSDIMNGVTQRAEDELIAMQENEEFANILNIADKWGINRSNEKEESLFKE